MADYYPLKLRYGASAAFTISLASLATSSTLLAGRESTAIDNTTSLYTDYLVGGFITVGTTPTASTSIEIWAYGSVNDSPTYPDVLDGTDSDETLTNSGMKFGPLKLLSAIPVPATTSDLDYWFGPVSLAAAFGGVVPKFCGLFVTHNTGVNLNATGGNHVINYTPVYANIGGA